MNNLQIFSNEKFGELRTVLVDKEVYFVGIDVARMLEYANASKAIINHCKGITKLGIPSEMDVTKRYTPIQVKGA